MENKINIDEIKYLIPDYVTGHLNNAEKLKVEDALSKSNELRDFYNEMKSVFNLTASVKFEVPLPQYWNNLLPRIHDKIEERERSSDFLGFKKPLVLIWKVIVPVAAVILIFVIYRITITTDETQYIIKNSITIKNDSVDTDNKNVKPEDIQHNIKENEITDISEVHEIHKLHRRVSRINESYAKNQKINEIGKKQEGTENEQNQPDINKDVASTSAIDEIVYSNSGDDESSMNEDTESELDKLKSTDQNLFLEQLSNANL